MDISIRHLEGRLLLISLFTHHKYAPARAYHLHSLEMVNHAYRSRPHEACLKSIQRTGYSLNSEVIIAQRIISCFPDDIFCFVFIIILIYLLNF